MSSIVELNGEVVKGIQLGSDIGFPTINLKVATISGNLEFGSYCLEAEIEGDIYKGMMHYGPKSIGTNEKDKIFCEIHLFDFDKDIYGEMVKVKVLKKIRNMREFKSERELLEQLNKDLNFSKQYFNYGSS